MRGLAIVGENADKRAMKFACTRLAPSPTGALHLGHARTFLVTWWMARQAEARIVMRMEDLDFNRRKEESVREAYEDLRWLGMEWDGGNSELAVVQSERMDVYSTMLQRLWERGCIYPCTCTRAEIVAAVNAGASAPHEGEGNVRYPGTCAEARNTKRETRNYGDVAAEITAATGRRVCWRLRVREGVIGFVDAIMGAQGFDVGAEVGDFPLTRFEGPPPSPAYQLACVADDHAMGIDCVIRGDDLLSSTPRQMLLYEAMGWSPPAFAHVPLVVGADGKRLAKRHGESRVAQFRAQGVSAEKVVGWAAWRSGMIARPREMTAREGLELFDLARLPRERVVLGAEDLEWLQ